jgi:hypothetical protein
MSNRYKQRPINKVSFSINAKLRTIILFFVIISLAFVAILILRPIQADVRLKVKENNFETNRRAAVEEETLLINMRSNSRILIQKVTAMGLRTSAINETEDFFWRENPQIAAVFFSIPGRQKQQFVNKQFLSSREIDERLVESYFNEQGTLTGRAMRGETILQNAATHFSKPVLAMFFPWQGGGVGGVLFSSENLNNNFGVVKNQSYMINTDGDILAHADFSFLSEGVNIADIDFIHSILDSPQRNKQELLESNFGVAQKITRSKNNAFLEKAKSGVQSLT